MRDTPMEGAAHEPVSSYGAIVVGGGPAGVAAALGLRDMGRFAKIALVERSDHITSTDADRSFTYLVDGRGLAALQRVGVCADALDAYGTRNSATKFTFLSPSGKRRTLEMPGQIRRRRDNSWWITRPSLMRALDSRLSTPERGTIEVLTRATCTGVELPSAGSATPLITLHLERGGATLRIRAPFVIGGDGIQSVVRTHLHRSLGDAGKGFDPVRLESPAAGLRFKVLRLPAGFATESDGGSPAEPSRHYVFAPSPRAKDSAFRLNSFAVRTKETPRTAIMIAKADHTLWKIRSGEELLETLRNTFPQAAVGSLVSSDEADRFAKAEGGRFPQPQYVKRLGHAFVGQETQAAVALVGDAIHCFPPDSGQGVNAALEDVAQLLDAIRDGDSFAQTIARYQARAPDVEALCHIAATAAPYQYRQDRAGMRRWVVRTLTKIALHKLAPRTFDLPGVLLVQDADLTYSEMWQRVQNPVHLPKAPRLGHWLTAKLGENATIAAR